MPAACPTSRKIDIMFFNIFFSQRADEPEADIFRRLRVISREMILISEGLHADAGTTPHRLSVAL